MSDEEWPYQELANRWRRQIEEGELRPGDQIPGDRTQARLLGVSAGVVRRAKFVLIEEGLLVVIPASGTYVRGSDERL